MNELVAQEENVLLPHEETWISITEDMGRVLTRLEKLENKIAGVNTIKDSKLQEYVPNPNLPQFIRENVRKSVMEFSDKATEIILTIEEYLFGDYDE